MPLMLLACIKIASHDDSSIIQHYSAQVATAAGAIVSNWSWYNTSIVPAAVRVMPKVWMAIMCTFVFKVWMVRLLVWVASVVTAGCLHFALAAASDPAPPPQHTQIHTHTARTAAEVSCRCRSYAQKLPITMT